MTTPEQIVEAKSSIKIGSTAKGDPTVEVKVVDGASSEALDALRAIAVHTYKQTRDDVGFPVGS